MKCPLDILALIILDSEGRRIAVKYRAPPPPPVPLPGETAQPDVSPCSDRFGDYNSQRRLEQELHEALTRIKNRAEAEALQCSGVVAVGLAVGDVCLYAAAEEDAANEMILLQAVDTLRTALSSLMKERCAACERARRSGQLQRQLLCENIDLVTLSLDEMVDHGILLETDPAAVVARVNLLDGPEPARQEVQSLNQKSELLLESKVVQAISQAKESLIKSLLSGAS